VHSEFEEHGLHGPRVAVVTRTFDLAENNPALTGDTPLLVLAAQHDADTHSQRIAHLGSRIELCQAPADVTGTWIRDTLTEHGLSRVVCEGGPAVVGLLRRDCVLDELDVTIAPVLVGAKHRQPAMGDDAGRVSVLSRAQAGDHTFLRCVIDDATPTLV
jgi:5-amino-6-(5-phosphoribosylamino)uracil reductase